MTDNGKPRDEILEHLKTFYKLLKAETWNARSGGYTANAPALLAATEEEKKIWNASADGIQKAAQMLADAFHL